MHGQVIASHIYGGMQLLIPGSDTELQDCWRMNVFQCISFMKSMLVVTKGVHSFKKWTSVTTNTRYLRLSDGTTNQANTAFYDQWLFPGVKITTNSQKSSPQICNIPPSYCCILCPINQLAPWFSMCKLGIERGAVVTHSAIVWTHRVRRPPFWLIVTALDHNCCLHVMVTWNGESGV